MHTTLTIVVFAVLLQMVSGETLENDLQRKLAETKENPSQEKVIGLVQDINAAYRNKDILTPSLLSAINKVRDEVCEIPGHARFLAERVANLRSISTDIVFDQRYHDACEILVSALPHFRSPETVLVVGAMLESDADVPTPEQKLEMLRNKDKGANVAWYYPSGMAGQIILALEIRHAPKGSGRNGVFTSHDIEPLRAWWGEVKAAQRSFSFKGQDMEYRFNPDGTWEALDSNHGSMKEPGHGMITKTRAERRPGLSPSEPTSPVSRSHRIGIMLLTASIFLFGLWRLRKMKEKN